MFLHSLQGVNILLPAHPLPLLALSLSLYSLTSTPPLPLPEQIQRPSSFGVPGWVGSKSDVPGGLKSASPPHSQVHYLLHGPNLHRGGGVFIDVGSYASDILGLWPPGPDLSHPSCHITAKGKGFFITGPVNGNIIEQNTQIFSIYLRNALWKVFFFSYIIN